jgi:hypothetical protein
MGKALFPLLALFVAVLPLEAQSNTLIDALLDSPTASFGDAVYLALSAARIVPETATPDEAVKSLVDGNRRFSGRSAEGPITLGEYAFVLMKAFDIRGGIFYSIFPGPRYACRELAFLGLLDGKAGPNRRLAGDEAVRVLGKVLEYREAAR